MKTALIRFMQREGSRSSIPWHFSFYKDILARAGHEADILDDQVLGRGVDGLVELCLKQNYLVVGITGHGTIYNQLREFAEKIKLHSPKTIIVAGGQIVADYEFIMRNTQVDILAYGEGEVIFLPIVEAAVQHTPLDQVRGIIFRRDGALVKTEPSEPVQMDELPDFNFNNIDLSQYDTSVSEVFMVDDTARQLRAQGQRCLSIFLARGCPYRCFFCYRHLSGHRTYGRERLDQLLAGLKARGFSFMSYGDECITANKDNLQNVCELSRRHGIYWMTSGRANHLTDEIAAMLKAHNCVGLQVGVESFDDTMLTAMNKRTTARQNIEAMNLLYDYGLHTVLQLVSGTPGENRQTLFHTRKGMWQCYFHQDRIASAILNPYPGSPAYYYALENCSVDRGWLHQHLSSKGEVIVNFSRLSLTELKAWQAWLLVEAALSFRIKTRSFRVDRVLLRKLWHCAKLYLQLLVEPLGFLGFNAYLLLGISYWLKPLPRRRYGDKFHQKPADLKSPAN